jgi:hypothetical protein
VSLENQSAPAGEPVQTNTSELLPGPGAPVDGVVFDENAQPDVVAAEAAAAAEAEAAKVTANRERGQRRYSDLSREKNEALQEAAYWRGVAEAKANGQQPAQPQQGQQPVQANTLPNGEPNPDNYPAGEFDRDYIRALAAFEAKQIIASERNEQAQRVEFESGKQRYQGAIAAAEAEGFEDGVRTLAQIARADRPTVDIITAAENPHWIGEHFARNPQDLQYAMSLPPGPRAMFIGKLDARFSTYIAATPAPKAAPASQPAPANPQPAVTATPMVGGRSVAPPFDPNKGSMDDYIRWRSASA